MLYHVVLVTQMLQMQRPGIKLRPELALQELV
jgi:hypothetical protein